MRREQAPRTGSRREFLRFDAAPSESHIASVLVQVWPDSLPAVAQVVSTMAGVETHGSNEAGRLVVTIETTDDVHLLERINQISALDRVVSAALVYHHVEAFTDGE